MIDFGVLDPFSDRLRRDDKVTVRAPWYGAIEGRVIQTKSDEVYVNIPSLHLSQWFRLDQVTKEI